MKVQLKSTFLSIWLAGSFIGCATKLQVADATMQPIRIRAVQTRPFNAGTGTVDFPPGVYRPDFKTVHGTYYRAPTTLAMHALGINRAVKGGLFIPSPTDSDQRQASWFDETGQSSLLSFGLIQPTTRHSFKEPLEYEVVENQTDSK